MRVRYSIILALASALALGNATHALATTFGFTATLSGLQEVGPNASPATGTAFLVYDDVANTLSTTVSFAGLLAPLTASHIHGSPTSVPGVNAGVIHPFASAPAGATSGTYSDVWVGLTPTQVTWLNGGLLYVNIHSQLYPGGEIRGQIYSDATPSRKVSWGKIKSLYR